ncbi:hypothetical protein B566_EDAN009311 [Ephemera danica]|nr:hypothetical protein B566_EDAN009311 [Ephemera danica]
MVFVFQVMKWYTCVVLLLIYLMTTRATSAEDKSRKRQKLQALLQAREKDPNFGRNWNRNRDAPPSNFLPRNEPYKKSNATQAPAVNKRFPKYKTKEGKGWKPLAGEAPILTVTSGRPRVTRATLTVVTVKRRTKARRGKVSRPKGKRNNKNRKNQKSSS